MSTISSAIATTATTTSAAAALSNNTSTTTKTTTSSNRINSSVPVPKWAKVTRRVHDHNDIHTKKSESFFRIEAALQWKRRLEEAQNKAWNEFTKNIVADPYLLATQMERDQDQEKFVSDKDETDKSTMTDCFCSLDNRDNNNNDNGNQQYCLFNGTSKASQFPFELLPCTCLIPPTSCVLDRHALADAICQHLRTQAHTKNVEMNNQHPTTATTTTTGSAVVWIPSLLSTLYATMCLVLDQIIHQEPCRILQQAIQKVRRKQSKRATSIQDLILLWASHTNDFENVILVLEDSGGFAQQRVREEFFHAIQEWRSLHGVPVSLVLINAPSDMFIYFGQYGMRLCYLSFNPNDWMDSFWKYLAQEASTNVNNQNGTDSSISSSSDLSPMPISMNVALRQIQKEYISQYGSFCRFVQSMSLEVVDFFHIPGSFVWDMSLHPRFLAWFCTHQSSKELLSLPNMSGRDVLPALRNCHDIQLQYAYWYQLQVHVFSFELLLSSSLRSDCKITGSSSGSMYFGGTSDRTNPPDDVFVKKKQLLTILATIHRALQDENNFSDSKKMSIDGGDAEKTNNVSHEQPSMSNVFEILQRYLHRCEGSSFSAKGQKNAAEISTTATTKSNTFKTIDTITIPPGISEEDTSNVLDLVNELIIVIGHPNNAEVSSRGDSVQNNDNDNSSSKETIDAPAGVIRQGVSQMLDKLNRLIGSKMDCCMDEWKKSNPLYDESIYSSRNTRNENDLYSNGDIVTTPSRSIVLRREIVDGLSHPARAMYALLQDRVSISRDEWSHLYGADPLQFSVGVWTLSVCGLIQPKWAKGGQLIYEKVSVVWC